MNRPRLICPFLIFSREISKSPGSWGLGWFESEENITKFIGLRNVLILTPFLSTLQRRLNKISSFPLWISLIRIVFPITSVLLSRKGIYEWIKWDIENNKFLHYLPDPMVHFIVKDVRQIENSSNCIKSSSATFPPLEFERKKRRFAFSANV